MSLYSKFCAWLSSWLESSGNASDGRSHHEEDMMFSEYENRLEKKGILKRHFSTPTILL
jgi:hypothetical protein